MTSAYLGHLAYLRCGSRIEEDEEVARCAACLDDGVAVNGLPVHDVERAHRGSPTATRPGLPLPRPSSAAALDGPVSRDEGGTPLPDCPRLGRELGVDHLLVKERDVQPDVVLQGPARRRGGDEGVEVGAAFIVVSSTGNNGAAAAYAAVAGIPCIVPTVASVPLTMKVLMQS